VASVERVSVPVGEGRSRFVLAWRRAKAPGTVSFARLRSRPGRNVLLLIGIALSVAMFVSVLGGSIVARNLSLQKTVAALPPDQRSFRIDFIGLPSQAKTAQLDSAAHDALTQLTHTPPLRLVSFRDFWLDGEFVRLAGIDGGRSVVRLLSGRLPRRCDPAACEVLQIGSTGGRRTLRAGGINLVRVGVGEIVDPSRFGTTFTDLRRQRAQGSFPRTTLLLAPDSDSVERLPSLAYLLRLRSWIAPIDTSRLHEWQVDDLLARESRAQTTLANADPSFTLAGPDSALLDARDRGDTYAKRMLLIGGSVAALTLGFAFLAAAGLRRGLRSEQRRLAERGATRGQLVSALLTEIGAIAALGWIVGIAAGAGVVAVLAAAKGLPAGETLRHALATPTVAAVLLAGFALAILLVIAAVVTGDSEARGRRVRTVDVAVLGAVVAIAVGMSRGALHTDASSSGGDTTFLLLLPLLIVLAGGLLAARLLAPSMRLAERATRRGSIAVRLAFLALARAPGRTAAAGAFVVVTAGVLVFAAAYRSTLERGAGDEAGFAVPLDVTLSEGSQLVRPLDAAPVSSYEHLAPGVRAYPVLRSSADVAGSGSSVSAATVLGVPSGALAAMHWRGDYSPTARSKLVRELRPAPPVELRGVALPAGAVDLGLKARLRGMPLSIGLVLRDSHGRIRQVPFGTANGGATSLHKRIPAGTRELLGLELSLTHAGELWLLHLAHEERIVQAPHGVITLEPPVVTDRAGARRQLAGWHDWVVRGTGAKLAPGTGAAARVSYSFTDVETLIFRRAQVTDRRPLPVLASPAVAAAAGPSGLVTLNFYNPRVTARIVATAKRFPTIGEGEDFVVADESSLAAALDADAPGTGTPGELWLSVPHPDATTVQRRLAQAPFSQVARVSRRRLDEQARNEPMARGFGDTLAAAAILALVLSVVGLWTVLVSDVRDERDHFFDLEAQGAAPETLRRHLRVRSLVLLGFGVLGGLLLGAVLSRLIVSLVHVTASSTRPDPPLVLDPGWGSIALGLVVLAAATALAVEFTVRRAFRQDVPERGSWSGE
jgi:ABC-type antimicrobial peptide transport system permease subunit